MAKKLLGIAALSALSMIPANATVARLQALGMNETDNEGSYYIQDDRNIFLNVANINNYKDTVILEWGANGSNFGGSSLQTDKDFAPKAKGGIIKSHGNYVYGAYLGNESNTSALLRGVATGAYAAASALSANTAMLYGSDNQIDLFFGGETSGLKWAVNGVYTADYRQSDNARDYGYAVRGGVIADKWDAFLNLSVGSKSNRTSTVSSGGNLATGAAAGQTHTYTFDGKLGLHLGGGYQVTDTQRVYGFAKKFDWEQYDSIGATSGIGVGADTGSNPNGRGQVGTSDAGFLTYALGYGGKYENGKGTLFTNIEYRYKSIEAEFTTKVEAKNVYVPVTVGYEYKATNWLTVRGSIIQNIWGYRENNNYDKLSFIGSNAAVSEFGADTSGGKVTMVRNSADVRAGATLTFGNLEVDGLLGLGGTNGTIGSGTPTAIQERGVFDMDRLLARVAMTYSF